MSVRLADVIETLEQAYPPRLAQSWDSVGLVCGDPADTLESVTIAVDATPAVVDEVPNGGLLLAHHPLLLRGVDVGVAGVVENPEQTIETDIHAGRLDQGVVERVDSQPACGDFGPEITIGEQHATSVAA